MARRRRSQRVQLALFSDEAFADAAVVAAPPAAPLPAAHVQRGDRLPAAVPRGLSSTDARRLVWLRSQGVSLAALAAQFHTSRRVVQRYVREPGRIRDLEARETRP